MNDEVLNFLKVERISVLTVLMPDGSLHSASLHFSFDNNSSPVIYFSTDKDSRKCEFLKNSKSTKGSFVIGFSETDWKTLQIDGEVFLVEGDEILAAKKVHYEKNPGSKKFENDPATTFLKLVPSWWRYSDLSIHPPKIISSD